MKLIEDGQGGNNHGNNQGNNSQTLYQTKWTLPESPLPENFTYLVHLMLRDCNLVPPFQIKNLKKYLNFSGKSLTALKESKDKEKLLKKSSGSSGSNAQSWAERHKDERRERNIPTSYQADIVKSPSKILSHPSIQKPWGIVFGNNDLIFVSSRYLNAIAVFDYISGEYLGKIGEEGSLSSKAGSDKIYLKKPAGMTFDYVRNCLMIADKDNHRVQIVAVQRIGSTSSITYKFIKSIGSRGKEDGQFEYPWGLANNRFNNILAVADSKNNRVQLFNRNGQLLGKFTAQGGIVPTACYNGRSGNYRDNRDHRDNRNGGLSNGHQITESTTTANFTPRSLCFVSSDINNDIYLDRLLITDFESHRIVIVDIDLIENIETKFEKVQIKANLKYQGAYGKSIGRFDRPQGIDSDRYGNWIVVDSKNFRVQILGNDGMPRSCLFVNSDFKSESGEIGKAGESRENRSLPVTKISMTDVAYGQDGSLALVDMDNNKILIF